MTLRALSHHSQAADPKKLDDFYRMLDKERKDWYNQQIEEVEVEPPKEVPSKRQFDLFDESSSESEDEKTQMKDALSK